MAVLGTGGQLKLKREAPDACLISDKSLDVDKDYLAICPGYWSGDHVSVIGLPVIDGTFPPNPSGYATYYGGKWYLGPNRSHITAGSDPFYKASGEEFPDGQFGDDAQFYSRTGDISGGEEIPAAVTGDYWIHIDELGYVSFYRERCEALAGCPDNRVDLVNVAGTVTIAPFGSIMYANAVWDCVHALGEYKFSDGQDTVTLKSICADPPLYQHPVAALTEYDNANLLPRGKARGKAAPLWEILCDLREWSLELEAPSVDCTSVSEKFGQAVKSLVTGGGEAEFFVDRKCREAGLSDGLALMKLLLMTEKGCKAEAEFWMISREGCGADPCSEKLKGDLYYSTEILITANALNVRPTELLAGTARFVSTGDIRLLETS